MPIYSYKCATCNHADDVMQKMSDAVLTKCPKCDAETFAKQLTAPGFALKGSGWYVTDFRGGNKPVGEAAAEAKADNKSEVTSDAKLDVKASSKPETAAPAPATQVAPASKPAASAPAV
ncbi:MAG: FmdB family zinc ribbon protein [Pseudomonadota bacterium]